MGMKPWWVFIATQQLNCKSQNEATSNLRTLDFEMQDFGEVQHSVELYKHICIVMQRHQKQSLKPQLETHQTFRNT